jgi:branched-chain amino acid transport system permease protein
LIAYEAGNDFPAQADLAQPSEAQRPQPEDHRSGLTMLYRENGQFKTTYRADQQIFPIRQDRYAIGLLLAVAFVVVPLTAPEYLFRAILIPFLILSLAAIGLNILVGYCGQISLGTGAFMAVGAYASYNFMVRVDGMPLVPALLLGGLCATIVGVLFGVPSLRIKGLYLAIATLAGQLIIEWTINRVPAISGGAQASIEVDRPSLFGFAFNTQGRLYFFLLFFAVIAIIATLNLVRSRIGRAFVAVRDQDIAAEIIGINIYRYKLLAFAISSFYAGVCGVLYTYYFGIANYEQFQLIVSIDYLAMIIIGGLGSVLGSIFGAIFVTLLPIVIRILMENVGSLFFTAAEMANVISGLRLGVFGALIIFFLIVEPEGLNRLWRNIRSYFRVWPFSY